MSSRIDAVIFDLDGVLVDSETVWDDARRAVVERHGGVWGQSATRDMMGMSSLEWSDYLRDRLGVAVPRDAIITEVSGIVEARYQERLPLLPGAREVVRRLAATWRLGLASSSNRTIVEQFLDASGLREAFDVTVSSEEVAHGKPAPDVYLEVLARMHTTARRAVAIEDSSNGLLSAANAGLTVVAIPNEHFPPSADALARTALVLHDLTDVTAERLEATVGAR